MNDKVPATRFGYLLLLLWLLPLNPTVAPQPLQAEQDDALQMVEVTLAEHQIEVLKQATTERFALIYGQQEQGSFVTLALRQLPQTDGQLDLIIATDSPHDPALEARLLRSLSRAAARENLN